MKIRIGDRVRVKRDNIWGTVVTIHDWGHERPVAMCLIRMDAGGYWDRTKRQLEKPPRYRGFPQARDFATAQRRLQEFMQ